MARVPFANVGLVKIPDSVTDEQALMLSDIFPTGYFGADMAHIHPGHTVSVFGCGPVGQFAIISSFLMGAGRVLAVDCIESRLERARDNGAEIINFEEENAVDTILDLTGGIGTDRAIDAVGVDAMHRSQHARHGHFRSGATAIPGGDAGDRSRAVRRREEGKRWHPGDAPSQVLQWAVQSVAKAGTISIIGVYPQSMRFFPIGQAMNKNLTIRMGNCHHRRVHPGS